MNAINNESVKNFIAGGVGGVLCVFVGHPFDLVKVRMQTMVVEPGKSPPFSGTFDCLRKSMKADGVRGIYRGVTAPLIAVTPMFAVSFWGYDTGQRIVRFFDSGLQDSQTDLTIPQLCVAGVLSAFPCTVIAAPTERIKCVMQVQANLKGSTSASKCVTMTDFAKELYRQGGIRSLYKGAGATLLRDGPGSALYFGTYEVMKRKLCQLQGVDKNELSPSSVLVAGGCAGMAMWGVTLPIDVVKSRFQTSPEGQYKGIYDVFKQLVRAEGYSALFKGFGPCMIRAFPANASVFMGVELTKNLWDNFFN